MDNLRKLAKHNSARLNTLYEEQKAANKRRVNSSATSSSYNSSNVSKRNIISRRPYLPQPPKALAGGNQHNISCNVPPVRPKEFLIKQKVKREYTN